VIKLIETDINITQNNIPEIDNIISDNSNIGDDVDDIANARIDTMIETINNSI